MPVLPPRECSQGWWCCHGEQELAQLEAPMSPSVLALFLLMHRLGILPATAPGRGAGAVLGGNWCRRRC